jgi:O-antigen ligase
VILAAILFFGIFTLWIPARWALAVFQVTLFALAVLVIVRRRRLGFHPVALLLAAAALWGVVQIVTGQTVYAFRTWEAVLDWTANLTAFSLVLHFAANPRERERFLQSILVFGFLIGVLATFTVLTSPPDRVMWWFDAGTSQPTLGPFVYRNQYASFVEAILPLAIVRAILDRRRSLVYILFAATLFASVVAAGSRTGSVLCLAEIIFTPVVAFARGLISGRTVSRVLAASVIAMVVLTAVVGWEVIWNRLQEPNPYSVRQELLRSSLEMVRDRPLAGFGLGTWSSAYPGYAHFDDGKFVNQAHNDWVQWAAEGGIPFFLLMLAIAVWSIRPAVRSLWGIGILAVFVHCLVDYPMQQRPALAAFFFAMLGVLAAAERSGIASPGCEPASRAAFFRREFQRNRGTAP